jgi:hypothetical protein
MSATDGISSLCPGRIPHWPYRGPLVFVPQAAVCKKHARTMHCVVLPCCYLVCCCADMLLCCCGCCAAVLLFLGQQPGWSGGCLPGVCRGLAGHRAVRWGGGVRGGLHWGKRSWRSRNKSVQINLTCCPVLCYGVLCAVVLVPAPLPLPTSFPSPLPSTHAHTYRTISPLSPLQAARPLPPRAASKPRIFSWTPSTPGARRRACPALC